MSSRHKTCALKRPAGASFVSVVRSLTKVGLAVDPGLVHFVEVERRRGV